MVRRIRFNFETMLAEGNSPNPRGKSLVVRLYWLAETDIILKNVSRMETPNPDGKPIAVRLY